MTEERSSTPRRGPVPMYALSQGADTGSDLLALMQAVPILPHPTFALRAEIWREQRSGLISIAEAQRRSAAIGVAPTASGMSQDGQGKGGIQRRPAGRPRHERSSPNDSRQYAQPMATTAARDDRLTPNAKAFLQVLRARCGKGRVTSITKGTAGNIMSRSTRTIRRYLVDLVRFGYVELEILRSARGLHLGLTVKLTALVAPFYEEVKGLAKWLAETPSAEFRPFAAVFSPLKQGVTLLSPKNQTQKITSSAALRNTVMNHDAARERVLRKIGERVMSTV